MLVFHVGSSAVGGTFFQAQDSGIPKIIFSAEEKIVVEKDFDLDRFLSLTVQALQIVVKKAYEARLGAPSEIFCVLSSPWHFSQTRIISLKKNTPFIFTAKLADDLIRKEIKIFEEKHFKKYGSAVRTIELKNIKTMLNGYETPKPLNQKAKELEMVIFVSISGEQVLKKIEETISKYFHSSQIKFSSFTMTSFTIVRDLNPQRENFLLMEISGELTDIYMIKKGALGESISFPLGRNFLTRGIASSLRSNLSEADSLISLFKDGRAEAKLAKKLLPVMNRLKAEWLKNFQESLANLSHDISIPAAIYAAMDEDLADFFSEIIKAEQFNQYILTESKFEVIFLNKESLRAVAVFEGSEVCDSSLIIDAVYVNRFLIKK